MMRFRNIFIFLFSFIFLSSAQAQDKSVFKLAKINERTAIIRVPQELKRGQNVLFVRGSANPDDDDYEIIANGKILTSKNGLAVIQMDLETLKKRPETKDFAVLLGAPKVFTPNLQKDEKDRFNADPPAEDIREPGYISLRYLSLNNKLESTGDTNANLYKNVGTVPKSGFELEWFLDFLSHFGFGLKMINGAVPIRNYYHEQVDANLSETSAKIFYRTNKKNDMRLHFYLQALMEDFNTLNTDETVLGTKLEASLLGLTWFYEPGDLLLKNKKTSFQFTYLKVGYALAISGTAKDAVVTRGTSGVASIGELSYGIGATMYLPWMPWVKRYTLGVDGFQRTMDIKFSGLTKPENVLPLRPIAENGSYKESESGIMFSIGVRFDDVIGAVFKPKE